jgi:hypothetical protein
MLFGKDDRAIKERKGKEKKENSATMRQFPGRKWAKIDRNYA